MFDLQLGINCLLDLIEFQSLNHESLQISNRMETFQDLSLPIPSRDQLHVIHQSVPQTPSQDEDQVILILQFCCSTNRFNIQDFLSRAGCHGYGIMCGDGFGVQVVASTIVCLRFLVRMN